MSDLLEITWGALKKRYMGHNAHPRDQFKSTYTFAQSYEIYYNID